MEVTAEKAVIFLFVVLLLQSPALAASIDSIDVPSIVPVGNGFRITASFSGDVCGSQANFYVDQKFINSKGLVCGRETAESDMINPSAESFSCGMHKITVALSKDNQVLSNSSRDVSFGNLPVITVSADPKDPLAVTLNFKDNTSGIPLQYLKVHIYNVRKGTSSAEWHSTDPQGNINFSSRDTGQYMLTIEDSDYCGNASFYLKRPLYINGPFPANPIVGDLISMAVPGGVGIKVYNSSGELYLTGATSIAGGVNFTINDPGNYTLVIGAENSLYGTKNLSVYVSAKTSDSLEADPDKAVLGSPVEITLRAYGKPLANATISIEDPDGLVEELSTGGNGTLSYIPETAGIYTLSFSDPRHLGAQAVFEARNQLVLDYTPKEPRVDRDITVYARDQLNNLVAGATVSIKDVVYGLTASDGKYTFRVPEPKKYSVLVTGSDYWDAVMEFTTISPLFLDITPDVFELGGNVHVKTYDTKGNVVGSDLELTLPDGLATKFNGTYAPKDVGQYIVSATKSGYVPVINNFTVKPHPLELSISISADSIYVNTTSHGLPVSDIPLVVEKTSGKERIVSDAAGHAVIDIKNDGRVKISANPSGENPSYGKITVVRNIAKMHDYSGLIMALSAVALVALIAIAVVYAAPRHEIIKKTVGPYFSGKTQSSHYQHSTTHTQHVTHRGGHSSLSGHKNGKGSLSRR